MFARTLWKQGMSEKKIPSKSFKSTIKAIYLQYVYVFCCCGCCFWLNLKRYWFVLFDFNRFYFF